MIGLGIVLRIKEFTIIDVFSASSTAIVGFLCVNMSKYLTYKNIYQLLSKRQFYLYFIKFMSDISPLQKNRFTYS